MEIASASTKGPAKDGGEDDWEAHDAMQTLMRAFEHVKNKKLMARVKKHAAMHAKKSRNIATQAERLAKAGRISPKAMERMARA